MIVFSHRGGFYYVGSHMQQNPRKNRIPYIMEKLVQTLFRVLAYYGLALPPYTVCKCLAHELIRGGILVGKDEQDSLLDLFDKFEIAEHYKSFPMIVRAVQDYYYEFKKLCAEEGTLVIYIDEDLIFGGGCTDKKNAAVELGKIKTDEIDVLDYGYSA